MVSLSLCVVSVDFVEEESSDLSPLHWCVPLESLSFPLNHLYESARWGSLATMGPVTSVQHLWPGG